MKGRIPAPAKALTLLDVYPVGSIYISTSAADPGTLFGGTWEQLKDRFLLGAGDSYEAGNEGGKETVNIYADNFPGSAVALAQNNTGASMTLTGFAESSITYANGKWAAASVNALSNAGLMDRNVAINNMPPYLVVYMWKRTA